MFSIDEDLWFGAAGGAGDEEAKRSLSAAVARELGVRVAPKTAAALAALDPKTAPIDRVIEVFETDPALAARVLSVVNSSAYGLSYRCRSIRHAVVMLGTSAVTSIAMAASLTGVFVYGSDAAEAMAARAQDVAQLAAHLAFLAGESREQAYATGLMADLGRSMLLQAEPDRYAVLCREEDDFSIVAREREVFGFDHASLGACVLRAWRIPAPIPRVIAAHHAPQAVYAAGGQEAALVCILRVADLLATPLRTSAIPDREALLAIAAEPTADLLELDARSLEASWSALRAVLIDAGTPAGVAARHSMLPASVHGASSIALATTSDAPPAMSCAECGQPTLGDECPACHHPLCPDHRPAGNVCPGCEAAAVAARRSDPALRMFLGTTGISAAACAALLMLIGARRAGGHDASALEAVFIASSLVMALTAAVAALRAYRVRMSTLSARAEEVAFDEPTTRAVHVPGAESTDQVSNEDLAWAAEQQAIRAATFGDVLNTQIGRASMLPALPPAGGATARFAPETSPLHREGRETLPEVPSARVTSTPPPASGRDFAFLDALRDELATPAPARVEPKPAVLVATPRAKRPAPTPTPTPAPVSKRVTVPPADKSKRGSTTTKGTATRASSKGESSKPKRSSTKGRGSKSDVEPQSARTKDSQAPASRRSSVPGRREAAE